MAARTLINVPPKAKRGEVIEIKTLISHIMETGFRHDNVGKPIPRDIITSFVCTYNGEEIFDAALYPGDRRQSVHHLLHRRDRERHDRVPMDRRQRLRAGSLRENHRRMSAPRAPAGCVAALAACCRCRSPAAEIPLDQRRSAYEDMSRDNKAMQDDDTSNPGMLAVLDGEALWNAKAGGVGQILRRLPRRRQGQHEGRRGALSGLRRRRAAGRSISSSASICPASRTRRRTPFAYESKEHAGAVGLCRACSRAASRSRRTTIRGSSRSSTQGREPFNQRQGQLNLSCAQCHDDNWGKHLAGNTVPQAPSDRLSDLPAGMAESRLIAAAAAQLHDRHARGDLCLWRAGVCGYGALPDVARARDEDGNAGGAAMSGSRASRLCGAGGRAARRQDHAPRLSRRNASSASSSSIRPSAPSSR